MREKLGGFGFGGLVETTSKRNALELGLPCRYVDLQVQSLFMGGNLFKHGASIEANYSKSPISAFQGHVLSFDASSSIFDTFLSHPQGDLN